MTTATRILEAAPTEQETLLLPRRTIGGWMAWVKQADCGWQQLFPNMPKSNWQATPGCLFVSREDAIKQASEFAIAPTELKLYFFELEK